MNEKIIFICVICMLIIIVFALGIQIYNDRNTIEQSERTIQNIKGKLRSIETGLDYIEKESIGRREIINDLRDENTRYETELDRTLTELRNTTTELDRIRRKDNERIERLENICDGIGKGLAGFERTIEEIEKNKID